MRIVTFYSFLLSRACRSADADLNMFLSAVTCLVKLQPSIDIQVKLIREKANYVCAAPPRLISQVRLCFFQVFGAPVLIGTGKKKTVGKGSYNCAEKSPKKIVDK